MTAPEAAELLGLQLHTVHRLIERGELAAHIIEPDGVRRRRHIEVARSAVLDYIARGPGQARGAPASVPVTADAAAGRRRRRSPITSAASRSDAGR